MSLVFKQSDQGTWFDLWDTRSGVLLEHLCYGMSCLHWYPSVEDAFLGADEACWEGASMKLRERLRAVRVEGAEIAQVLPSDEPRLVDLYQAQSRRWLAEGA